MEIFLLVVELVEYDFEVRPGRVLSLEKVEHVLVEKVGAGEGKLFVDGFDFLEDEDALLGAFLFEVEQEELVLGQGEELRGRQEGALLREEVVLEVLVQLAVEVEFATQSLRQQRVPLQLIHYLPQVALPDLPSLFVQRLEEQREDAVVVVGLQSGLELFLAQVDRRVGMPLVHFEEF